jgi:hypothetical protein
MTSRSLAVNRTVQEHRRSLGRPAVVRNFQSWHKISHRRGSKIVGNFVGLSGLHSALLMRRAAGGWGSEAQEVAQHG